MMNAQQSSSSPPHVIAGIGDTMHRLYGMPRAWEHSEPGAATIILGTLDDGSPVTVSADRLEWFEALDGANRQAWAGGKVRGGMTGVTS